MEDAQRPVIALGLPEEWFVPRLSLGLGNPNSAGALCAMVLVSLLPFAFGAWWRRILGVGMALALGLALAMSASRGAVVALAAGLLVLGVAGTTARADRWMLGLVAAGVIALFAASPSGGRIHAPQADASLASRWTIFSRVPAMVAAAPGGWGVGRSAEAYQNWFQPIGDWTLYKHVLSTHAIWLVERSWAMSALYVGAWIFAFVWCAVPNPRWMAGGLACWVAFAVAASFSHVGESIWLWLLPWAWLVVATGVRLWHRCFPGMKTFAGMAAMILLVLAGLILVGRPWGAGPHLRNGLVELSSEKATRPFARRVSVSLPKGLWIRVGQEIRRCLPREAELEYAWDSTAEMHGDTLFLMGQVNKISMAPGCSLQKVVWISPQNILPWNLPAQLQAAPIIVVSGQQASITVAPWQKYFEEGGRGEMKIIAGQGDFPSDPWGRMLAEANLTVP